MAKKRHFLHSLTIEVIAVLLASMSAFQVCNVLGIRMSLLPFVMAACYAALKLLYHSCIWIAGYIADAIPPLQKLTLTSKSINVNSPNIASEAATPIEDIQKKRMELFHYEFQREQQLYQQQKEKAEDEKLCAILKYTRNEFKKLDFNEADIFQICECVRYFVINRQVLSMTEVRIKRHSSATQISLKNFAWNIAFQYSIDGDMTTSFVMNTFAEWFSNSTFETVRKNLRTTTGRHKIEINENIIDKIVVPQINSNFVAK